MGRWAKKRWMGRRRILHACVREHSAMWARKASNKVIRDLISSPSEDKDLLHFKPRIKLWAGYLMASFHETIDICRNKFF